MTGGNHFHWSADRWQEVDGGPLPLTEMDIHVEEIMQVYRHCMTAAVCRLEHATSLTEHSETVMLRQILLPCIINVGI